LLPPADAAAAIAAARAAAPADLWLDCGLGFRCGCNLFLSAIAPLLAPPGRGFKSPHACGTATRLPPMPMGAPAVDPVSLADAPAAAADAFAASAAFRAWKRAKASSLLSTTAPGSTFDGAEVAALDAAAVATAAAALAAATAAAAAAAVSGCLSGSCRCWACWCVLGASLATPLLLLPRFLCKAPGCSPLAARSASARVRPTAAAASPHTTLLTAWVSIRFAAFRSYARMVPACASTIIYIAQQRTATSVPSHESTPMQSTDKNRIWQPHRLVVAYATFLC
jgi:hypothetical protein